MKSYIQPWSHRCADEEKTMKSMAKSSMEREDQTKYLDPPRIKGETL